MLSRSEFDWPNTNGLHFSIDEQSFSKCVESCLSIEAFHSSVESPQMFDRAVKPDRVMRISTHLLLSPYDPDDDCESGALLPPTESRSSTSFLANQRSDLPAFAGVSAIQPKSYQPQTTESSHSPGYNDYLIMKLDAQKTR